MLARSERRLRGVVGSLSTARGVIGLGLVEQALLSGAAFLLTAYLARQLSVEAFGAYCVATAIAILLESGLYLMLGDGIPALAARLAPRRWQHLYGAVFVVSVIVSLGFAAVTMAAALYLVASGPAVGAPPAAGAR